MGLEFDRPIGAKADEAELLYISALHQSKPELNQDASIDAEDIRNYLISRHGIDVSVNGVEKIILRGNASLDLISLVSILFIPTFCKLNAPLEETRDLEAVPPQVIKRVLEMILHDATGDAEPKKLTLSLVREIFTKYGEDTSDEEMLQELLLAATGGKEDVVLDEESFLRALTHDLNAYDIQREATMTTNFGDVFGDWCDCDMNNKFEEQLKRDLETEEGTHDLTGTAKIGPIRSILTGKGIDFIAGTYSCKYQVMCVWIL